MVVKLVASSPRGCQSEPHNYSRQSTGGDHSRESSPDIIMIQSRCALNIPYQQYALAYLDPSGNVQYELSPSIQKYRGELFCPEFEERFLRHTNQSSLAGPNSKYHSKSKRAQYLSPLSPMPPQKRQRLEDAINGLSVGNDDKKSENQRAHGIWMSVGNEEEMLAFYSEFFKAFQQINCRQIAKAYIKFIEPRKQAKHPYNGGRAGPEDTRDPEKTKPDWWPPGVIHKEPDHLKKIPRVNLLIHIFRNLRKSHGITSQKLKAAGAEAQKQCRPGEKAAILNEIYRVREIEERYERGEIDADHIIYVPQEEKTDPGTREGSETASESDQQSYSVGAGNCLRETASELADVNENDGSLQIPPQTFPEQNRTVPIFAHDRNSLLPLSMPVAFEPRTPSAFSPMGIKPDYEEFTPIDTTPRSSDGIPNGSNVSYLHGLTHSPNESEYMNPRNFSPEAQSGGNYGSWSAISFQQPIFSPVDYGNGGAGMIPQHYMPQSVPVILPSHGLFPLREVHGAGTYPQIDGIPVFSSPISTGSFRHPHVMAPPRHPADEAGE
ncbi:uncharacterized protein PADG_05811 [Paracoccidioides brasiliensis Pb18]|uniref:Subtelomeric hrmA-associated cluster protein AFUB-079030/YDR124W-like helical bundle domain-containing protein n=1 Tax=Paracoccidioides brasiliensis (strain Pb18) TaxID=502780 RepID=C1GEX5_PARBD|nr:uncharacterized protein PADG_05811 [Paracoccidioides brasiliensis Pb18]EEH49732.2 hypothetical protein PADG_05811 [Paracoccidioides brasiliensis Pb18]